MAVCFTGKGADVLFEDVPLRPVISERGAGGRLYFNQTNVVKTRLFKSKRLAAQSGAEFKRCEILHNAHQLSRGKKFG